MNVVISFEEVEALVRSDYKVVRVAWESQKESNAQTIAWLYSLKVDLEVVCPGFSF